MFDTIISNLVSKALNRRENFDTFEEYIASRRTTTHYSACNSNDAAPSTTIGAGILRRLRHWKIGKRFGYESVDAMDNSSDDGYQQRLLQMLPRVYNATTKDVGTNSWQPVTMDAQRNEVDTVLDRFVRAGQVDRSVKVTASDELKMERFNVIWMIVYFLMNIV